MAVTCSLLLCSFNAVAEEIKPGILRTPDARFEALTDFPYPPNYVQIDEVRLHYVDVGPRDGETILLLHGEPTWAYLFRKMIPIFVEAGYRVVAPDLVGFGRSDKFIDEDEYSYQMQVDYMVRLIEKLELTDVTFFGQDWGGLIGLRVVARLQERFSRVVVSNTGLPAASGLQGWIGYPLFKLAVWWEGEMTFEELQSNVTFPRWVAYNYHVEDLPIGRLMTAMGGEAQVRAAYEAPFPDRQYKAATQIMPYLVPSQLRENETVWREVYERWSKPFLVAFTDSDPVTTGGHQTFLDRVPTAKNVTIRNAGHFVQEDAGPELAQLIVDFMQGKALPDELVIGESRTVEHNELTAQEMADGWQLLFDGVSLDQWRTYRSDAPHPNWQVEDGVIKLTGSGGGDLITRAQFSDFDLSLDWQIARTGNSGIFILADEREERIYFNAPEVQILDDARHPDRELENHRSGSLYDLIASPPQSRKPAGAWNTTRIRKHGPRLSVWHNGESVADVKLQSDEWNLLVSNSKFSSWEGFGKNPSGHIGLQDHGDVVSFRNIRILNLVGTED